MATTNDLRPGIEFRDDIKGDKKWTKVQQIDCCPSSRHKVHVNLTDCWDRGYPVVVKKGMKS